MSSKPWLKRWPFRHRKTRRRHFRAGPAGISTTTYALWSDFAANWTSTSTVRAGAIDRLRKAFRSIKHGRTTPT